ncbi:hypothetical protein ACJX0J_037959, partial [Zea mays]
KYKTLHSNNHIMLMYLNNCFRCKQSHAPVVARKVHPSQVQDQRLESLDRSDGAGSSRRWGILLASQMSLMASLSNRQVQRHPPIRIWSLLGHPPRCRLHQCRPRPRHGKRELNKVHATRGDMLLLAYIIYIDPQVLTRAPELDWSTAPVLVVIGNN